jgi:hypothetical protein
VQDSGERRRFGTGAVRDRGGHKPRPDLASPHANLREGEHLRAGAEKYALRNWETGMPISECVASLTRHLEAYKLGKRDEDHMAAIRTNAGFILHYEEEIKAGRMDAALDDMPHYEDRAVPYPLHRASSFGGPDILVRTQKRLNETFGGPKPGDIRRNPDTGALEVFVGPSISDLGEGEPVYREKKPFTVYLCGPITGKGIDFAWRNATTDILARHGIVTLNPLRGKKLDRIENHGMSYDGKPASTETADRDRLDVEQADMIFAYFPYNPPRQSIGSLMEMGGAAIGLKKPILLCTMVPEFNEHLFTRRFCILEQDFSKAIDKIVEIANDRSR